MSDNYIIEIRPASVGITVRAGVVVRDGWGYRFFAATHAFDRLEGQLFASPKAAEKAALHHVANGLDGQAKIPEAMSIVAPTLKDSDIDDLAAYYSAIEVSVGMPPK